MKSRRPLEWSDAGPNPRPARPVSSAVSGMASICDRTLEFGSDWMHRRVSLVILTYADARGFYFGAQREKDQMLDSVGSCSLGHVRSWEGHLGSSLEVTRCHVSGASGHSLRASGHTIGRGACRQANVASGASGHWLTHPITLNHAREGSEPLEIG
jgi:hypothetical protein